MVFTTPEGPTTVLRLDVSYRGGPFYGFAANRDVATIEGVLGSAIETYCQHRVHLTCAGRTDRGVHASGQVVSFDIADSVLARSSDVLGGLVRAINSMCRPHIAVRNPALMDSRFSARFSATSRRYEYTIFRAAQPDPAMADRAWHVSSELELAAMINATSAFVGTHDFTSFCKRPEPRRDGLPRSLMRTITSARWIEPDPSLLVFEICASAFCHQMVRSIVGFLVDIGEGRRRASDVVSVLAARDRQEVSNIAPPQGLCLCEVGYEPR